MDREVPDEMMIQCDKCDDLTVHEVLRAKMGKASIEGTFRCTECGKTFSSTLKIPRLIKVKVVVSDGPLSKNVFTTIEEDEKIAIGDEFFLEDGTRLRVCSLDMGDGQRKKRAKSQDVKVIWAQQFDVLNLKVTINDNRRSYSRRIEAEPDDEFIIGQSLSLSDMDCYIHAIKTRDKLVNRGTCEARDIVRMYGKRKGRAESATDVPIIDEDEEDE